MSKKIKGFTLIECLVALAILGIASLVMAQIYAAVSRTNLNNHNVNTSLSYQMKIVEKATKADAVEIYYGDSTNKPDTHSLSKSGDGNPPDKVSGVSVQHNYITITKYESDGKTLSDETYSFPVDIFVLLSRDSNDIPSSDINNYKGMDEKNISLRYKYILGHSN